jgi:hypothetical protein
VVFDPFEEQLDLPAVLVKRCYRQGRQDKVFGQEYERLAALGIFESNAPQVLRIMLGGVKSVEQDRLISNNSVRSVASSRKFWLLLKLNPV